MSASPELLISPERLRQYSGDRLRDIVILFTVIDIITVSLRFLSLSLSKKPFGLDDLLAIPALLFCLGQNTVALVGIRLGRVGYHLDGVEAMDPAALVSWAKILVATPIIYSAACAMPRMMLLTLYLRIFRPSKAHRIACYALISIVCSYAVAVFFVGGFVCIPLAYMWDKTIPGGNCINIPSFYRWGTLPNIIIDFFMLILPLPTVWKLQAPRHIKIGLALTLMTGSIGIVTSICRCVAFFENNPLTDGTWKSVTFLQWSVVEPGVYLVAACLPCYRILVQLALDCIRSSTSRRSSFSSARPLSTQNQLELRNQRTHNSNAIYRVDHIEWRLEGNEHC